MRSLLPVVLSLACGASAMDYTAVFTTPPRHVPTRGMPDGPLLGNGDVGVVLAGPPEAQRFYLGKNDFWTRTPGKAKVITVGWVDLKVPMLEGATYRQEQDLARAEVRGIFTKSGLTFRTRSWVDANANLLLTELQCDANEPVPVFIGLSAGEAARVPLQVTNNDQAVKTGEPTPGWFTRKADDLPGQGRLVAVATRVVGAEGLDFALRPGAPVTVATAVLTDLDAKDNLSAAKRCVAELTPQSLEALTAQHRAWWARFWARSFIEIPDKELEKHWHGALYVLGSCSRPGKVAPGLWGNWVTTDNPNWQGDFHLNYNFQAPFYIVYSANHADLSLPLYRAVLDWMPQAREFARERGWKGVHYPVSIGPWGLSSDSPRLDLGQRSNAAYAALNFIWYWQYTEDRAWLKDTGYPYLREVAGFWEDYLTLEEGQYVIHNDSIHEGSGTDTNPILSLGLVHTLFKNVLAMSQELHLDANQRAKWQDILDRLSPFPLQERGGKTVFRCTEKGTPWWDGNTLGIQQIFPAGAIRLDSKPELLAISRDTIDEMHRWADYNGFSSWYTACARVGYPPEVILSNLRAECDKHSLPNLLLYYGGGGIESCGGFLALNEMLFQSHEGVLRFFPCWPRNQDARFGNLRAVGAFLVSAELKNGSVGAVRLISEAGRPCAVQNPWPGKQVALVRNGKPAETLSGARVSFETRVGEEVAIRPAPAD